MALLPKGVLCRCSGSAIAIIVSRQLCFDFFQFRFNRGINQSEFFIPTLRSQNVEHFSSFAAHRDTDLSRFDPRLGATNHHIKHDADWFVRCDRKLAQFFLLMISGHAHSRSRSFANRRDRLFAVGWHVGDGIRFQHQFAIDPESALCPGTEQKFVFAWGELNISGHADQQRRLPSRPNPPVIVAQRDPRQNH